MTHELLGSLRTPPDVTFELFARLELDERVRAHLLHYRDFAVERLLAGLHAL